MSKWTGVIFGILDVLLSLPEDKTFTQYTERYNKCQIKRQIQDILLVLAPNHKQAMMTNVHSLHIQAKLIAMISYAFWLSNSQN